MKKLVKKFNNLIKKTIFNIQNKTNDKLQTINFNFVKNFNNLTKKSIFKVRSKINNKFQISNFHLVKNFNNLIKKTILKVQNKTNNKFQISNFNKYLIIFICLPFFYLFYLSIPILYDKNWVQLNIENQLLKEFKINFSVGSDVSYRILPTPHFIIRDSKIFKKSDKTTSLSNIKDLKVFIKQNNFFDKKKMILRYIKINNANFSLLKDDFKLLKNSADKKLSNKRIEINNSNIFFKNDLDEVISIINVSKALLFFDDQNLLNLFNLKGNVFNIPFSFNFSKKFDLLKSEEINIEAKTLKLNIYDKSIEQKNNFLNGENIISFLNTKINTIYKIKDEVLVFHSNNSRTANTKLSYNGELSISPFDLNLNINLDDYGIINMLNINSILTDLLRTKLLFNDNISINTSITANSNLKKEIFQNAVINFVIVNGKINFNKTRLINKKIGFFELNNSNLFFEKNSLILNTDININIANSDKLFSLLQTNKKHRKPIKNILINLDYNFLTNQIKFNNLKIRNKETNDDLLKILDGFNDNNLNNWNKSKILINELFENYEG